MPDRREFADRCVQGLGWVALVSSIAGLVWVGVLIPSHPPGHTLRSSPGFFAVAAIAGAMVLVLISFFVSMIRHGRAADLRWIGAEAVLIMALCVTLGVWAQSAGPVVVGIVLCGTILGRLRRIRRLRDARSVNARIRTFAPMRPPSI
jgi:hypothetical protein